MHKDLARGADSSVHVPVSACLVPSDLDLRKHPVQMGLDHISARGGAAPLDTVVVACYM